MHKSSIIHHIHSLRTLALGVLTSALLGAGAHAFPINLLSNSDFTQGEDGLAGWTTTLNPPGTSTCCSPSPSFIVSAPGEVVGPFDGAGPFNIDFNHAISLNSTLQTAVLAFSWNDDFGAFFGGAPRVFSVQIVDASNVVVATLFTVSVGGGEGGPAIVGPGFGEPTSGTVNVDVADTLNALPRGAYTFRFDSFIPEDYTGPGEMRISGLSLMTNLDSSVVLQKGEAVPSVDGAKFTTFGTPAISANGTIAVRGKWSSPKGSGEGVLVGGVLVAKVGDEVPAGSGAKIRWLKDPVIDDAGHVAIPALLVGTGITPLNDDVILSNATGILAIAAQQGTQAPDAPEGAQLKTLVSVAASGNGGTILLGYLAQGLGGVTAANDNGLWASGADGVLRLLLREGTTVIGGKTVKAFAVLKSVSGTPGQTHAFNSNGELVSKVVFTDGSQAVVHTPLP